MVLSKDCSVYEMYYTLVCVQVLIVPIFPGSLLEHDYLEDVLFQDWGICY